MAHAWADHRAGKPSSLSAKGMLKNVPQVAEITYQASQDESLNFRNIFSAMSDPAEAEDLKVRSDLLIAIRTILSAEPVEGGAETLIDDFAIAWCKHRGLQGVLGGAVGSVSAKKPNILTRLNSETALPC